MSIANTAQAEHWNTGEAVAHWVDNQARYDRMNAPFAAMILDAADLRPGGNVLDVGCGCGGTTLAAARLIAPGQAVGLDLSGPMLARARADAGAAGLGNAVFLQGDAQVHPLEPARFGTVLSRFGVMFFADPVAAFANVRSATRPAGRLVFVCWQPLAANQWLLVPGAALAEHVPPAASGPATGPACSRSPTRTGSARSWPRRDGGTSRSPRSTRRSWWAAAGASTTPSNSCALRQWAGPCSPEPTPAQRTARSRRSAPRSVRTPPPTAYTWVRPYGSSRPWPHSASKASLGRPSSWTRARPAKRTLPTSKTRRPRGGIDVGDDGIDVGDDRSAADARRVCSVRIEANKYRHTHSTS